MDGKARSLSPGEVWSCEVRSGGIVVRCASGALWLTDGHGGDYVLRSGQYFATGRRARIVLEALGPGVFVAYALR